MNAQSPELDPSSSGLCNGNLPVGDIDAQEHEAHLGHLGFVILHAVIDGLLQISAERIKGGVLFAWSRGVAHDWQRELNRRRGEKTGL